MTTSFIIACGLADPTVRLRICCNLNYIRCLTSYMAKMDIRHPDIRVKHCGYGHSVATLLNPRGVTTVSRN
jgi:hypothetical protein